MRSPRRSVPSRSRLTVRPSALAPLARSSGLTDALRSGREALADVERQLEALLAIVRTPADLPDVEAPDRLARAARRAGAAVARLAEI